MYAQSNSKKLGCFICAVILYKKIRRTLIKSGNSSDNLILGVQAN